MSCGIYKITNKINNKIYIGQSINIQQRFYTHCSDALTKQDNNYFHNAIRKYGKENFYIEIIEECLEEELNNKEIYWIKYYNATDKNIGYKYMIFIIPKYSYSGSRTDMFGNLKITSSQSNNLQYQLFYKDNGEMLLLCK